MGGGEKNRKKKKKLRKRYSPNCIEDCFRCYFSPYLDSIEEGDDNARCCPPTSTCCCACLICVFSCTLITLCFYISDKKACGSCMQFCGETYDESSGSSDEYN